MPCYRRSTDTGGGELRSTSQQSFDVICNRKRRSEAWRFDAKELNDALHPVSLRTHDLKILLGHGRRNDLRPDAGIGRNQAIVWKLWPIAPYSGVKALGAVRAAVQKSATVAAA